MFTFKHFFLLNFHCLTYSDCLISFVSINALRKWHSTNFRFERMTLLLQDVSKHLWSFFIHFLLSNDWNWHYFYQKLDVWQIRSMWHWKWKYIFTKIDTGYGLCDISYQDWQHCRLNICKRNILVELTNTVYVNSTNVTSNIETAVLSVSSIKVEHCFQKNHTILQLLFSIVSTFAFTQFEHRVPNKNVAINHWIFTHGSCNW